MSAEAFVGYDELIAELRRLAAERRTGVLFIATGDNEGGQLALRDGLIVAARFRRKTGLEAAYDIRKIRRVRFTFTRDLAPEGSNGHTDGNGAIRTILTAA